MAISSIEVQASPSTRTWWSAGLAVAAVGWGAQQFAPLLLMYQSEMGLSSTVVQATFGMYVLGLIPGLLAGGPLSDRYGRRRIVAPSVVVSAAATVLLILGSTDPAWLFAGRLLAGVASGAAFSAGAAWIKELSGAGAGHPGARRLTVATSVGFGAGPLVAGVLAQWAPDPATLPYLPHLILAAVVLPLVLRTAETVTPDMVRRSAGGSHGRRFLVVVVPLAPWVFGSASIAMAYLPGLVKEHLGGYAVAFGALITLLTAGAGIVVQSAARRLDLAGGRRLLICALSIVVAGLIVAVLAAWSSQPGLVVVAALVLGAGYGCCQTYGLLEVGRLAGPGHLARLTAAYQAVSYVGFAVPFPLAALAAAVPAWRLLAAVAVLAVLTLGFTTWQAGRS